MNTLYVPTPRHFSFIKDGDYVYNFRLLDMARYTDSLRMVAARSLSLDVRTYSRLALSSMRRRYKIRVPRKWSWQLSQYFCLPGGDAGMFETDRKSTRLNSSHLG